MTPCLVPACRTPRGGGELRWVLAVLYLIADTPNSTHFTIFSWSHTTYLLTYLLMYKCRTTAVCGPAFDTIRPGGPTRSSADVSVPRRCHELSGFPHLSTGGYLIAPDFRPSERYNGGRSSAAQSVRALKPRSSLW